MALWVEGSKRSWRYANDIQKIFNSNERSKLYVNCQNIAAIKLITGAISFPHISCHQSKANGWEWKKTLCKLITRMN